MLYGELAQFRGGFTSCPALVKAVAFLLEKAPSLPDGRHELGEGMYTEMKRYSPSPADKRRYESHIKYIDVQTVFEGEEIIYCRPLEEWMTVVEDRLAANDVRFHAEPPAGPECALRLRPGLFALLMPKDAHKTECFSGAEKARKAIVKVPVGLVTF